MSESGNDYAPDAVSQLLGIAAVVRLAWWGFAVRPAHSLCGFDKPASPCPLQDLHG